MQVRLSMSNRLGGLQGTAYIGTNANQPPNWSFESRDPNQYDTNYSLGDLWLNTTNQNVWVLVSLAGNNVSKGQIAKWVEFVSGGHGDLVSLTGNNAVPVFGDPNNNVNVVGQTNQIVITGTPINNTLTAALDPLNFYSSATWTPVLSFGGSSTGITYLYRQSYYTRIGNVVFINTNISVSSVGIAVGTAVISGLPFPVNNPGGITAIDGFLHPSGMSIIPDAGYNEIWSSFIPTTSTLQFSEFDTTTGVLQYMTNTNFSNTGGFTIQGFYYI